MKDTRTNSSGLFMIYGATGHTGRLTASLARDQGYRPILAGRNKDKLNELAARLGLPAFVVDAESVGAVQERLADVSILVNMAGPFSATAKPLAEAALGSGTHYLDIAGELPVFKSLQLLDERARSCGTMIMPGAGFVVVPSDCLAAHMIGRQPDARYLRIGVSRPNSISSGSAETMVELINENVTIRQGGELTSIPVGGLICMFDFGDGPRISTAVSLPDVLTAYCTTGIPNIESYVESTLLERSVYHAGAILGSALKSAPIQSLLKLQAQVLAPAAGSRGVNGRTFVAEAEDPWRRQLRTRLRTPEGYGFTAQTVLVIVEKILAGRYQAGFQTPGRVYGANLLLELEGVVIEDMEESEQ